MPRARSEYGGEHAKTRAKYAALMAQGQAFPCARCGILIRHSEKWDLGHVEGDRSRWTGPEHVRCNRAAGGRNGARVVNARRRQRRIIIRRDW